MKQIRLSINLNQEQSNQEEIKDSEDFKELRRVIQEIQHLYRHLLIILFFTTITLSRAKEENFLFSTPKLYV